MPSALVKVPTDDLQTAYDNLSTLYHILNTLSGSLETSEFHHALLKVIPEATQCKEFAILFFNQDNLLTVQVVDGFSDNQKILNMKFALGEGISGRAAQTKQTIYIADTSSDPRYLHYKGEKMQDGSFLCIPLIAADRVLGVLNIGHPQKNAYSASDIQLFESIAGQIAVLHDRSQLYMKTKELAVTDELTGISNRRHFQEALKMEFKRALRFDRSISLLMIDVDYFKNFNDKWGHIQGDAALRKVAQLLESHVREVDTVARFGGEEFVVLLADSHLKEAAMVAEKLRVLVESFKDFGLKDRGYPVSITVSIGVASFPELANSEEELLDAADIALYRAKASGRNQVCVYAPQETQSEGIRSATGKMQLI